MQRDKIYHRIAAIVTLALFGAMVIDILAFNSQAFIPILVVMIVHLVIELIVILWNWFFPSAIQELDSEPGQYRRIVVYERTVQEPQPEAPKAAAEPLADSPFVYNGYTLYRRMTTDRAGGKRYFYFFAKKTPKSGQPCAKPEGYHVGVNKITGLAFLKKGSGLDGEVLKASAELKPNQCQALTGKGGQCRNNNRANSKYCASHKGYRPPAAATVSLTKTDTKPKSTKAKDTLPSVRKPRAKPVKA